MSAGWRNQLDMAIELGKRRIVLHGNVLDAVFDETKEGLSVLPFLDWLVGALTTKRFVRIAYYNFRSPPQILEWDADTPPADLAAALRRPTPPSAADDPWHALGLLQYLLQSEAPAAAIISNAELAIQYPSEAAVALQCVTNDATRRNRDQSPRQNIAVHLYARETAIPGEFIRSEPDTALVLVSRPTQDERQNFSKQRLANTALEKEYPQVATRTDGFRLRELEQFVDLAITRGTKEADLTKLLSEFRMGRQLSPWKDITVKLTRETLEAKVRGQKEPIDHVINSLYRAKHAVQYGDNRRRPAMVLFFVGPTGVGKTHMARQIANIIGSEESLKIIDMSEYRQDHSDQRLIGPPPGYVGHLEGGQLTNWVKERPRSVVLFDEVEKGHDRILDLFLQVLEGARLTDGKGETVDFGETILVFTSNIGTDSELMNEGDTRDDWNSPTPLNSNHVDYPSYAEAFKREVELYFNDVLGRPELFNRLRSNIVVFRHIDEASARSFIELRLSALRSWLDTYLTERSLSAPRLVFSDAVKEALLHVCQYEKYGLRDVNNALEERVEPTVCMLVDNIIRGARAPGGTILINWDTSTASCCEGDTLDE
jgi:ATP-dependent Clp protease ATP-binding subunit ClpA